MDRARVIDLNCDLGEGAGYDAELMPWITSANIACGGHAGDAATMEAVVRLAVQQGVSIGAHPGFNDREHFGRRALRMEPGSVRRLVEDQVRTLQTIAHNQGARLSHVKPHGALYQLGTCDREVAEAIAEAVREVDPVLVLFGAAGGRLIEAGSRMGLRTASEVFADRAYEPDGSLTPRTRAGALILEPEEGIRRVLRLLHDGLMQTSQGADLQLTADTVCVHGDTPGAVAFVAKLRCALEEAGFRVQSLTTGDLSPRAGRR